MYICIHTHRPTTHMHHWTYVFLLTFIDIMNYSVTYLKPILTLVPHFGGEISISVPTMYSRMYSKTHTHTHTHRHSPLLILFKRLVAFRQEKFLRSCWAFLLIDIHKLFTENHQTKSGCFSSQTCLTCCTTFLFGQVFFSFSSFFLFFYLQVTVAAESVVR